MNAGQLIMQTPAAAALSVAAPAPSTAASLPVGEKEASAFAEVMSGITPQDSVSARAAVAADMMKPQPAPVPAEKGADDPKQLEPLPDLLTAILAEVDNLAQEQTPVSRGAVEETVESEEKMQTEVSKPQDVALSAAGAMIAAMQQVVGRMPEEETGAAAPQESSAIGEQVPVVSAEAGKRGDVKIDCKAEVKPEPKAEEKVEIKAEAKPEIKAEVKSEVKVEAKPEVNAETKSEVKAEAKVGLSAIPVQSTVSAEQATAAPFEKVEKIAVKEARAVAQGSAVQSQSISKAEVADPAPLSVVPDKGQATPRPAEFKFSRSSAVVAALGDAKQAKGSVAEESTHAHEGGTRMAVKQQPLEEAEAGFNGSDAGSENRSFEGFSTKTQEIIRPEVMKTAGAHQPFSVAAPSSTPPQLLQAEKTLPSGSSEHIAAQVRDQLGSRELKPGSEQITIKLSPDHLGEIKVNFRLEDQHLKVEIVTESRFAKESLLQHADSLKESLARQNISMDKFEVTTGGGNSGSQGGNAQGEWRELARNRQSQQWLASGGYRTPANNEVPVRPAYAAQSEHAMLDLHF